MVASLAVADQQADQQPAIGKGGMLEDLARDNQVALYRIGGA
jgi:hypothetical protein